MDKLENFEDFTYNLEGILQKMLKRGDFLADEMHAAGLPASDVYAGFATFGIKIKGLTVLDNLDDLERELKDLLKKEEVSDKTREFFANTYL